ncbi:L-threonylcarbamoyladenylate synthase, partial [Nonlabens ulvanivorans]
MAQLIRIYEDNPSPKELQRIAKAMKDGALIIYPTDTVYGLGCDINHKGALEKVAKIRGVKLEKANFSFICESLSDLSEYV